MTRTEKKIHLFFLNIDDLLMNLSGLAKFMGMKMHRLPESCLMEKASLVNLICRQAGRCAEQDLNRAARLGYKGKNTAGNSRQEKS
jgi:hypothetical protein